MPIFEQLKKEVLVNSKICLTPRQKNLYTYEREGWNKRGGGAKYAKSLNLEVGINMKGRILWKKLMHDSNKRGVEGGKNLRNQ